MGNQTIQGFILGVGTTVAVWAIARVSYSIGTKEKKDEK